MSKRTNLKQAIQRGVVAVEPELWPVGPDSVVEVYAIKPTEGCGVCGRFIILHPIAQHYIKMGYMWYKDCSGRLVRLTD